MKILFQGDSITDAGRDRNDFHDMGQGYAKFASAMIADSFPDTEIEFINLGISGNRSDNLLARTERDIVDIQPDIVSILLGVNDVWHELSESPNGVELERWDKMYRMLIDDTLKVLPNIKIIICEPFVLEGAATSEQMDKFLEVQMYAKAAKQIAEDYNFPFVALQDMLHEAALRSEPKYVLDDGVHPATGGAKLIADAWLKVFNENK